MAKCQWTRGRPVGRGSSATVSLATDSQTGAVFAVKSAELVRAHLLQREQRILSGLDCPRIVAYKGHDFTTENDRIFFNLFMEYVDGGTLADAIRSRGGRLEEPEIRSHTRRIMEGLVYLHSRGLVHCDLKGRNVLMGSDGVKIADLGCARMVDEIGHFAGTPLFMAPEVARGEEQSFPADVWALACTVIEMATGCSPWPDTADPVSALFRIGYSGDAPELPSWLSDEGKDFLSKCLIRSPKERWTANQLLEHPFLNESNSLPKLDLCPLFSNSPKSTLDQSFWDSLDDVQSQQEQTQVESMDNFLAGRIQRLSGGNSLSRIPDWTWGENWVTVRREEAETTSMLQQEEEESQIPASEQTGGSDSVWWGHESRELRQMPAGELTGGSESVWGDESGELSTSTLISEGGHSEREPKPLHLINGYWSGPEIGSTCTKDVIFSNVDLGYKDPFCSFVNKIAYGSHSFIFISLLEEFFSSICWQFTWSRGWG